MIYYLGLKYFSPSFNQSIAVVVLGFLTTAILLIELARFTSPEFHRYYSSIFMGLMRRSEMSEEKPVSTGMIWFFLGHLLTIFLFEPCIATVASLYLVLGDMTAAIVGISFGHIKIGHKSLEGSAAMWAVCIAIGCVVFWHVDLGEYPIVVGATVATIIELLLPSWIINDNLSVPLFSALVLHLSFRRIGATPPMP